MIFWENKKFLKADDLLFCFFISVKKKKFFILGVAHADLFVVQMGPKKQFLEVFPNFFQNLWVTTEAANINWIP